MPRRFRLCLLLLGAAVVAACAQRPPAPPTAPEIAVDGGRLRGERGDGVEVFRGIPFAAPPVGGNRWRAPQPVTPWQGVREATAFGPDCMQLPFPGDAAPLGVTPAEDCLYLNVWRPPAADAAALPVLVWIYGGGYVNGGASPAVYDGSAFARDGVILVSFNYRVGRFGFFAHPALSAAAEGPLGNYGHMDQIAALQWVRRNIAAFGGDPGNVTVFGESAGGGSVLNLAIAPPAQGLFRRMAVMSGGGRSLMGPLRDLDIDRPGLPSAETVGMNFARGVGIAGTGPEALRALRALPAERVRGDLNLGSLMAAPAVAPTWAGGPFRDGPVVAATPEEAYAVRQAPLPVLIGSTSADIGFAFAADMEALFAPFGDAAARARALYDPDGSGDLRAVAARVGMDRTMTEPARYIAGRTTAAGGAAWLYRFGYVAEALRDRVPGAPHASEIPYVFQTLDARDGPAPSADDRAMAAAVHGYFVSFARDGDPDRAGLPHWPRYDAQQHALLEFGRTGAVTAGPDPWTERLDLIEAQAEAVSRDVD
ncbi:carboxylesterase/lipase family protein [Coralloluteibacterium stylophorae]|uniref:Carboxylic ester hydrolase n=1 Tax=Coralloluteibacterium stylophorae TaxID=1776034 RepID=A0A8J7VQG8_9GAMM|nr:carboxylesterase family protein [Coralloluteibacterium stylophorae]MBS7457323.1 carboxylesterase family protein [Coralloluteibacterium stylophorae]